MRKFILYSFPEPFLPEEILKSTEYRIVDANRFDFWSNISNLRNEKQVNDPQIFLLQQELLAMKPNLQDSLYTGIVNLNAKNIPTSYTWERIHREVAIVTELIALMGKEKREVLCLPFSFISISPVLRTPLK